MKTRLCFAKQLDYDNKKNHKIMRPMKVIYRELIFLLLQSTKKWRFYIVMASIATLMFFHIIFVSNKRFLQLN